MKIIIKNLIRTFFGKNINIHISANISRDTSIGNFVTVCSNARISSCSVGEYSYIGEGSIFERSIIHKFVSIGPRVISGLAEHPTNFISTYPGFYSNNSSNSCWFGNSFEFKEYDKTVIYPDVWIGTRATILSGLSIGVGSIVAAGAVVTKDVEPYSIVAGVPARIIRYRFDEDIRKLLLQSKWWDQPIEKIVIASKYSDDPVKFIEKINKL